MKRAPRTHRSSAASILSCLMALALPFGALATETSDSEDAHNPRASVTAQPSRRPHTGTIPQRLDAIESQVRDLQHRSDAQLRRAQELNKQAEKALEKAKKKKAAKANPKKADH